MQKATIIKYQNRKLYFKGHGGGYVSLSYIADLPKDSYVVKCHRTKRDITEETLFDSLVEKTKRIGRHGAASAAIIATLQEAAG
jgi:polyhydroxyalkanoate synthesis regulator protein